MTGQINTEKCIAILANPLPGKDKAKAIGQKLQDKLAAFNISRSLFTDAWPDSIDGFTEIWIIGGDGTINYFINHYKNIDKPLVLFKGGTGNDFAWKLYGDISVDEQFELVLKAAPISVDAASCNDKLFVVGLGIGFEGEVLQSMGAIRWLGGHLGYLWVVFRKIFSFKESLFSINTGYKVLREKFLLVILNNSSRTGGGFLVAPKASLTDGLLDMILCKPLSVPQRLRYLPVIEKGKHLHRAFINFSQQKEVRIECDKELPAHLDGELIRSKVFVVKVLPGLLKFKY